MQRANLHLPAVMGIRTDSKLERRCQISVFACRNQRLLQFDDRYLFFVVAPSALGSVVGLAFSGCWSMEIGLRGAWSGKVEWIMVHGPFLENSSRDGVSSIFRSVLLGIFIFLSVASPQLRLCFFLH